MAGAHFLSKLGFPGTPRQAENSGNWNHETYRVPRGNWTTRNLSKPRNNWPNYKSGKRSLVNEHFEVSERFHLTESNWTQVFGFACGLEKIRGAIFSSGEQNKRTVTILSASGKAGHGRATSSPYSSFSCFLGLRDPHPLQPRQGDSPATSSVVTTGLALQKLNHTEIFNLASKMSLFFSSGLKSPDCLCF